MGIAGCVMWYIKQVAHCIGVGLVTVSPVSVMKLLVGY